MQLVTSTYIHMYMQTSMYVCMCVYVSQGKEMSGWAPVLHQKSHYSTV